MEYIASGKGSELRVFKSIQRMKSVSKRFQVDLLVHSVFLNKGVVTW
jgi:hypothetical protein